MEPLKLTTTTLGKPRDVTIAVMGPTGSGKSTFINVASNSNLRVGETLLSCTDKIEHSQPFRLDDCLVTLVDTPGFDDTAKSDAEILNIVCDYLATEYKQKRLLHGIIYMHRISDNRMSGTATRNLHFFQDLCGTDALMNAIIVTNMWGLVDPAVGNAREQELKSKDAFFKPAVSAGTKVLRHDNTASSAHRIVREMLHNTPRPFRLQRELVDEGRRVFETAAGETLLQELAQLEQRHTQEMRELEAEFQDAVKRKDEEARQEIEEAQRKVEAEQAKLAEQKKRLMEFQLLEAQLMQSEAEARADAGPGRESEDLQRKLLTAQHAEDDGEAGGEGKRPPPSFIARLLHALCPCFGFVR